MSQNLYVLLWFEAPLQSWGVNAKFDRRTTLHFPSKSGVLGLLLAAMGKGGEQQSLLAEFADLEQTVICYTRTKNGKVLPPPIQLCDFHMVGSGYDDKDNWQKLHIPKTSKGTAAVGGGTKLTYRYYLQDTVFAIVLEIPLTRKDEIHNALTTPYWDICLGRKSCVPTEFVYQGIFEQLEGAMSKAAALALEKGRGQYFCVKQGKQEGEQLLLSDVPLCFGKVKKYAERFVTIIR